MPNFTVMIAEDHSVLRESLTKYINNIENFTVLAHVSNGKDLINSISDMGTPDLVILDVNMPILDGFKTMRHLNKKYKDEIKVLVLSMYEEFYIVSDMLQKGASGYISKKEELEDLEYAMNKICSNGFYISSTVSKTLIGNLVKPDLQHAKLTELDKEIIRLVCDQKNTAEIAQILRMSENTVNTYRAKIIDKTGSSNLAGLVVFAIRTGLYIIN